MKTTMIKSLVLVGMMSVSSVMFGNTLNNSVVNNDKSVIVHHDKHCKGMHCHSKHCKCMCHEMWMDGHDKGMGGHKMNGKDMNGGKGMTGHGMDKGMNNGGGMVKSGRR